MTITALTPPALRPATQDMDACPVPAAFLTPLPLGQWLAGEGHLAVFRPCQSGACPLAVFARAALGLRGASVGWGRQGRVQLRAGDAREIVLPPWCTAYVTLVDREGLRRMTAARALDLLRTLPVPL